MTETEKQKQILVVEASGTREYIINALVDMWFDITSGRSKPNSVWLRLVDNELTKQIITGYALANYNIKPLKETINLIAAGNRVNSITANRAVFNVVIHAVKFCTDESLIESAESPNHSLFLLNLKNGVML